MKAKGIDEIACTAVNDAFVMGAWGKDQKAGDADNNWPYSSDERKTSKDAWWRTLGRGRKRDTEGRR